MHILFAFVTIWEDLSPHYTAQLKIKSREKQEQLFRWLRVRRLRMQEGESYSFTLENLEVIQLSFIVLVAAVASRGKHKATEFTFPKLSSGRNLWQSARGQGGWSCYTQLIKMAASVLVCVSVCVWVCATSSVPGTNQLKLKTKEQQGEGGVRSTGGSFLPMMLSALLGSRRPAQRTLALGLSVTSKQCGRSDF